MNRRGVNSRSFGPRRALVALAVVAALVGCGEEGTDRTDILLPAPQDQLILQVSAAAMAASQGLCPSKRTWILV